MCKYYLVFGSTQIFLFESQFQFLNEETSLRHYEKGLVKGLFAFDRARIDQVWSELGLWGLIGRVCSVELVRVLCAFGCELQMADGVGLCQLRKSFQPVTYFIPASAADQAQIRHLYHWPLESNSTEHIPVFLELDDRLILGSYYFTSGSDADSQLSNFCKLLEQDLCLPTDSIRVSLLRFFEEGIAFVAESGNDNITLAYWDRVTGTIRGFSENQTLFFLGVFDDAA